MTERKRKAKIGRPMKHGGYSLVHKDELIKENPRLRQYLEACREGFIEDLGGEENLSEMQRVMIDRIISRLAICRLIEIYVEKYGAFRRDRLKRDKVLELEPALGNNYLAFSNSIDRALIALGLERRAGDSETVDLGKYIQGGAESGKAERSGPEEGQGQGEEG